MIKISKSPIWEFCILSKKHAWYPISPTMNKCILCEQEFEDIKDTYRILAFIKYLRS